MSSSQEKAKYASFPRDALKQAEIVRIGWKKVGERLNVPNLDVERFKEKLQQAQEQTERAEQLKAERSHAIEERNVYLSELWDLTKRIRNAAKATFGDTSTELAVLLHPSNGDEDPDS